MTTPPTRARYLALAALCAAALVAYVQRNSIGVAENAIRAETGLDKQAMGWVMSAFFLTYAVFQLPTGWVGKVLGTRKAMTLFAVTFSATAGAFALASGFPMLAAARLGMGAAQSGIFPCAVYSISRWLPDSRRSLASGLLGGFMSVGGALGAALMGGLLEVTNWRIACALFCVPGFAFAIWFYWWFRNEPREHPAVNDAELAVIDAGRERAAHADGDATLRTPWKALLTSVPVLALCGQQACRAIGYIFFASWFATYLRETRGVDDLEVGILNSLPLLAVVLGSPVGGMFSDWVLERTGNRRLSRQGVAAVCMLACGGLILASQPVENPWGAVLLISAGSFFAAFGGPCAYTATIDMGGRHVTMVFSLMNTAGNIGAFAFPVLVPVLLAENPDIPGSGNWDLVLYVFAGIYVAAAACWLLADPTKGVADN